MDTITFIATYFSISAAFAIFVLVLLIRRRRKQKARFENDWLLFQDAVKKDNGSSKKEQYVKDVYEYWNNSSFSKDSKYYVPQ